MTIARLITAVRAKGQITIPSEVRRLAHLDEGDLVEVELVADGILLRPKKLIDSTQAWFWTPAWQEGERQAAREAAAGKGETFGSGEEFLEALRRDGHDDS